VKLFQKWVVTAPLGSGLDPALLHKLRRLLIHHLGFLSMDNLVRCPCFGMVQRVAPFLLNDRNMVAATEEPLLDPVLPVPPVGGGTWEHGSNAPCSEQGWNMVGTGNMALLLLLVS